MAKRKSQSNRARGQLEPTEAELNTGVPAIRHELFAARERKNRAPTQLGQLIKDFLTQEGAQADEALEAAQKEFLKAVEQSKGRTLKGKKF